MSCVALRSRFFLLVVAGVGLITSAFPSFAELAPPKGLNVDRDIYYGTGAGKTKSLQSLDIYWNKTGKPRPVIIYVHGGGWAFGDKSDVRHKPDFFALHKISFVSMNYRLRWEYKIYDQLEDVVSVVNWVKRNHAAYNLDPNRIILMGYGAGGFLVSLVATDEDLLRTQGLDLGDLRAVVSIDNPSYDIVDLMQAPDNFIEKRRYRLIFGDDENVWSAFSPTTHISADKGIPPFAILFATDDESAGNQAKAFSKSLRDAKVDVIMIPGNNRKAESVDDELGMPGDKPTLALMAFIGAAL